MIWNSGWYDGDLCHANSFSVTVKFKCYLSRNVFHLTNIYGPCSPTSTVDFINWLYNFDTSGIEDWIIAGDFNLIRCPENRNREGTNISDILLFNDLILHLDLAEIAFQGRQFSWSNMQDTPLLEKLDWVFTSSSWALSYPDTSVRVLGRPVSDHSPFVINIGTHIPKSSLFRFENYWLQFLGFLDVVALHWNSTPFYANAAKTLNSKFKQVRYGLKVWSKELSRLGKLINNSNFVLALLDGLEDQRPLSTLENAFRRVVKGHLNKLLEAKRIYWKQRNTTRWVQFGNENTGLFQAMATYFYLRKYISSITLDDGSCVSDHGRKAHALWLAYKERLGISEFSQITYDLASLLQRIDLPVLNEPFSEEEIMTILKDMPSDHAPGPDGFKKCWRIIKGDILMLCSDFANGVLNLESITGGLITMIPKIDCPLSVNDYRPISLLNHSLKFLTKLLANRLQKVILDVVHANQYGFIKGRTIQDCLAWAF